MTPLQHGAHDSPLDIDARQSVDCFAVLLDLWSCEEQFLEAKMKVFVSGGRAGRGG